MLPHLKRGISCTFLRYLDGEHVTVFSTTSRPDPSGSLMIGVDLDVAGQPTECEPNSFYHLSSVTFRELHVETFQHCLQLSFLVNDCRQVF